MAITEFGGVLTLAMNMAHDGDGEAGYIVLAGGAECLHGLPRVMGHRDSGIKVFGLARITHNFLALCHIC